MQYSWGRRSLGRCAGEHRRTLGKEEQSTLGEEEHRCEFVVDDRRTLGEKEQRTLGVEADYDRDCMNHFRG